MDVTDVAADPAFDLLTRSKISGRTNWESYLFMPYSLKMQDTLRLYTPIQHSHWVDVEWDIEISKFNENPPVIPIAANGRIEQVQFDMACQRQDGRIFLRRLCSHELESETATVEKAIDIWSVAANIEVERLNAKALMQPSILHENKKELLHFLSAARNDIVRPPVEEIQNFIGRNPRVTILHVQRNFSDFDPTTVVAVLCQLLIAKKISANLTNRRIDRNLALELR